MDGSNEELKDFDENVVGNPVHGIRTGHAADRGRPGQVAPCLRAGHVDTHLGDEDAIPFWLQ